MTDPIFTLDAFKDLDALKDLPEHEASIGGIATQDGDVGVTGRVSVDVGKPGGWSVSALGEWTRKAKGKVMGMLTWKGGRQ